MQIQSDLNKLSEWCEENSLFLNVVKCKTITFSRTRYPAEFAGLNCGGSGKLYKKSGDQDEKMNFLEHVVYQKTIIRVQRPIHSEVSLDVLVSSEARLRQLCMEPVL
jgi:hypothetical protein